METARELSRQETNRLIGEQIIRAASVVRKTRHFEINNGESAMFNTPWANLAYDTESDEVKQARLHGVFDTRLRLFTGRLSCVQLYTRDAGLYDSRKPRLGKYTYAALFCGHDQQITVPEDDKEFPIEGGEEVLPDTSKWRELDYILGQIESQA